MRPPHSWRSTFRYALEGIRYTLRTQINMRMHAAISLCVIAAGIVFHISRMEWLFIITACALVMMAELLNTAVEAVVDLVSPDAHPLAKAAKDTAAGAVLLAAVFAVIIGLIVFYQPLLALLRHWLYTI
ncbi:diacylglycerol kinase family protein [Paenibacillus sp. P96]|uniref:Diacylglycerol kinase family protein n=1 Tax=Paenibacillus zeirhizosphaerae TaxID=2987519 RepID=A0ABT9FQI6_9BACL|nr:diacylglycerol kinase family protein [Paenibacillus sp. P96]MDP4096981.1 diacylglycerol kinase family protein [Paenibacillus sp. P96]